MLPRHNWLALIQCVTESGHLSMSSIQLMVEMPILSMGKRIAQRRRSAEIALRPQSWKRSSPFRVLHHKMLHLVTNHDKGGPMVTILQCN